ncbi:YkyA family protein [Halobacillus halophilus]|uniref:YkyA family protein n=1 Tax=Halobacillus halophilus TaxID=1570 RepID=UPI001CD67F25|nr:YkyA family protein [Halobacillus halophilus]MCA1012575.1 YkyA family protein [Halobacillus halophilus]
MTVRLRLFMVLAAAIFIMTACTGPSAQEEVYNHLEEAVEKEEGFREQQQPLVKLENEEQELYKKIIDLNMDQFDKIQSLSKEAAGIVEERQEKLEAEKESIDAAKEEFDEIEPLIDELDEENAEAKETAKELVDTMDNRYQAYQKLYEAYNEALKLDSELYEMLQNKELAEEDMEKKIESINNSYDQVIEANKEFNQHTDEYNKQKKELYEALDLNISYEETEKSE